MDGRGGRPVQNRILPAELQDLTISEGGVDVAGDVVGPEGEDLRGQARHGRVDGGDGLVRRGRLEGSGDERRADVERLLGRE